MGILESLFGRKPAPRAEAEKAAASTDLRQDPNLLRVYDAYGRELFITKDEWRKSVLPGAIKDAWDNPEKLYQNIVTAINDGFRKDVVAAAKHLHEIDPKPDRGACLWGIVLMEEGRLAEAEKVLRSHCDRHGEDGYVLTNLAKVYAKREDHTRAETTLWHALELDPNQENAVSWYGAIHQERGGEAARLAALRKLAALKGSWRAQLWLARAALEARNLDEVKRMYRECLNRSQRPIAADVLMQMSGDLGNAGQLQELLNLVEPEFDAATHGLSVGNNLIKAHVDLGHLAEAQRILNGLYALKRGDYAETLSFWDTEIAKARVAHEPVPEQAELKVDLLVGEGPVWLKPDSPARSLFELTATTGPIVTFLGSSADVENKPGRIEAQLADAPGRLSRALPLFFAEQAQLGTNAQVQTIIPWIGGRGGFVLMGARLTDEQALTYGRHQNRCNYLAVSHLDTRTGNWTADIRLFRMSDGQRIGELAETFPMGAPAPSIQRMARQLRDLLCRNGAVQARSLAPAYSLPPADHFASYLVRLEQLLAVRCAAIDGRRQGFLSGEREILAGNLDLCLNAPESVSVRVLLAQTLLMMKHVRPDVVAEFRERVATLQRERRLPEPAAGAIQKLVDEAFAV